MRPHQQQRGRQPHTLHRAPYTLHPTPCTLHSATCTLHPATCTLHPTPFTVHSLPCTLHPTPCTLYPAPCTLHPASVLPPVRASAGRGAAPRLGAFPGVRKLTRKGQNTSPQHLAREHTARLAAGARLDLAPRGGTGVGALGRARREEGTKIRLIRESRFG